MSRIRIVKGKIIKITGGNHNMYAGENIIFNSGGAIYETGVEKGISYGVPEKPPVRISHYFIDGYWSNKKNEPINQACIGSMVRFHVQTKNISDSANAEIDIQLREYDTPFILPIGPVPVVIAHPFDDTIELQIVDNTGKVVKRVNKIKLDSEGKGFVEFRLSESLYPMFKHEAGALELYFDCRWLSIEKAKLPAQQDKYLIVSKPIKNLYIKPAIEVKGYSLPEIRSFAGELILFAIEKYEPNKVKRFMTINVKMIAEIQYLKDINEIKKTVYTKEINLSKATATVKKNYEVTMVNEYFKIKENAKHVFVENEITVMREELPSEKTVSRNLLNGALNVGKKALDVISAYDDAKMLVEMFPEITGSGKSINLPPMADMVGLIPGAQVLALGFKMTELLVENVYNQTIQDMEEETERQYELAKNRGLSAVKSFMGTLGAEKFGYYLRESVSQKLLDNLLIGKIETAGDFDRSWIEETQKAIDTFDLPYNIIFRRIIDNNRDEYIFIVETVFIKNN